MSRTLPYYLAGEWEHSEIVKNNYNPYTGNVLGEICFADTDAAERAIKAATKIFEWLPQEPASARSEILRDIAAILKNQADIIPQVITAETGKPIRFARREVARTIEIFELYSEQTVHTTTVSTLEPSRFSAGAGKIAFTRRVPVGPVLAITPFVFPFNFPAKKIAGALACGCPVILKPSPYAPQSALLLAKLLDEADLPEGLLSVLPASDEVTQFMVRHNGIKAINFTGSSEAGWFIRSIAGNKKVLLNLGNSSANIVHKDVRNIKIDTGAIFLAKMVMYSMSGCVLQDWEPDYRRPCGSCPYNEGACKYVARPIEQRALKAAVQLAKARAWLDKRDKVEANDIIWALTFSIPHRLELTPMAKATIP